MSNYFQFDVLEELGADAGRRIEDLLDHLSRVLGFAELRRIMRMRVLFHNQTVIEPGSSVAALVDEVANSDEMLWLTLEVSVEGEETFAFDLKFYGKQHVSGLSRATRGSVLGQCNARVFSDEEPTLVGPTESLPKGLLPIRPRVHSSWHVERLQKLFEAFCGIRGRSPAYWAPEHVVGQFEAGALDPWIAPMVFHRDIMDFARDYELMRRLYYHGGTSPCFYSSSIAREAEESIQQGRQHSSFAPRSTQGDYVDEFRNNSPEEVVELVERIDDAGIVRLANTSGELLAFWAELAAEESETRWVPSVTGSGGAAMTRVRENLTVYDLVDFYRALWNIAEAEA